mmetsp:Transcript_78589/g.173450  ORF Transcript_78589/g.173450 Transcript_78589/m.173450 type:complete len:205 (-) Transcript_78589:894-1508(-)
MTLLESGICHFHGTHAASGNGRVGISALLFLGFPFKATIYFLDAFRRDADHFRTMLHRSVQVKCHHSAIYHLGRFRSVHARLGHEALEELPEPKRVPTNYYTVDIPLFENPLHKLPLPLVCLRAQRLVARVLPAVQPCLVPMGHKVTHVFHPGLIHRNFRRSSRTSYGQSVDVSTDFLERSHQMNSIFGKSRLQQSWAQSQQNC